MDIINSEFYGDRGMSNRALQKKDFHRGRATEIAREVACLELSIVNIYFVGPLQAGDRAWVLVDTGLPTSQGTIVREAERRFGQGVRPSAIVMTHGHIDHAGSVRELAELWDVPVYAHRLEAPYLNGRSDYPPGDTTVGGGALARLGPRLFSRRAIDLGPRLRLLPEDGTVPGMPGWRWIHTPGHTPGHVSLFREEDRVLIAGDAFVTTHQESFWAVMTRFQEVWRPPAYFTTDWDASRASVRALARLQPSVAGTGHGIPMSGERLLRELTDLARNFDEVMPDDGRYVRQPARADEDGVYSVPPPRFDPLPTLLVSAGVLALIGTKLLRARAA
jgi:glyoxylase-like metal-dependent hydrolase (beta-lactamase superfamily II)